MDYDITQVLYATNTTTVIIANPKQWQSNDHRVAIKRLSKTTLPNPLLVQEEINAMKTLHHNNIVKYHTHFSDSSYNYIVMEYINGQDLFSKLEMNEFAGFSEKSSRKILLDLARALNYCHQKNVAHLDIKLENCMLTKKGKVKLIDFGLCESNVDRTRKGTRYSGSPDYCSPQILANVPYDPFKADVWSLGTVLFATVYGEIPFSMRDRLKCLKNSTSKEVGHPLLVFPDERAYRKKECKISDSVKDLITKMLKVNEEERISLKEVLQHKWLKGSLFTFNDVFPICRE